MRIQWLVACILLLGGCAGTPLSDKLEQDWPGTLPESVELVDTPFYPQTQHHCGPAALATILQSLHVYISPETLSARVYLPRREGSLQIEMAAAARSFGMLPYPLSPGLEELFTELASGHPVLVLQNLGFESLPRWHYAVVIGYDSNRNEIILRSGTTRRWVTPIEVFERTWQRAGHWALVILPAGKIPVSAQPLRYLQTAYAFEETGKIDTALTAYRSATARWPENTAAWMTYGNSAQRLHNWPEAVDAFKAAVRLEPDSADGWNNLAYALHASGCKTRAKEALLCGLKIAPADNNLVDSWNELVDGAVFDDPDGCTPIHCVDPKTHENIPRIP